LFRRARPISTDKQMVPDLMQERFLSDKGRRLEESVPIAAWFALHDKAYLFGIDGDGMPIRDFVTGADDNGNLFDPPS
jgi:hypothetical protein